LIIGLHSGRAQDTGPAAKAAVSSTIAAKKFEEPLLAKFVQEPGWEHATIPLALFRGVDRPIPSVMRPNHLMFARDDMPDDFAYTVAKALDERRELFQYQIEPWY